MAKRENGIFVSASALVDYIKCSQKVYYRIFEPELKTSNREMVIGEITHRVVEKAWQDIDVALNLGRALAESNDVDPVGKQSIEHYIHVFFEKFYPIISKDDKVEKFFKTKLEDDVFLVGKFDRVSRGMVFDWKTDANPPKTVENHPQFIIYDLAYRLVYKEQPSGIYLASLKDGRLVRYNKSKEHYDTLVDVIIPQFVDDVRKKNFIKQGLFNGACYRCPFKNPCLGDKDGMVFEPPVEE